MTPIVVTPPTAEPISLIEAKAHLRQVFADDDDYIEKQLIPAARLALEGRINRALAQQRIRIGLDGFCPVVKLPRLPFIENLSAPSVVIRYLDENGDQQTLPESVYHLNQAVEPHQITLVPGQSWPTITRLPGSVTYEYDVGYADDEVPESLKQWMLLAIGAMYDHRDMVTAVQTYELPEDFMCVLYQPYMVYE